MGERGRELCGLGRSPDNSLMVACGDDVVVAAAHNAMAVDDAMAADDAAATDEVVAEDGAMTMVGAMATDGEATVVGVVARLEFRCSSAR